MKWLTDQGAQDVDSDPQYLLFKRALEKSLRNVARSGSRLFKKGDLKSRFSWEQADPWRKHRCIIFLIRYFLKMKNYSPFFDFKFADYKQRVRVVRTFEVRFFDLTEVCEDEPEWSGVREDDQDGVIAGAAASSSSAVRASGTDGPAMEWDDDLNDFVQVLHYQRVSSLIGSCVLTKSHVCPYTVTRVSLRCSACVHTPSSVCPYAVQRVSLLLYVFQVVKKKKPTAKTKRKKKKKPARKTKSKGRTKEIAMKTRAHAESVAAAQSESALAPSAEADSAKTSTPKKKKKKPNNKYTTPGKVSKKTKRKNTPSSTGKAKKPRRK